MDDYTKWCLNLFNTLAEGGVWGVPRSGLIFTRRKGQLVLTAQMPHDGAMPRSLSDSDWSADELTDYQRTDYARIKREFLKASIDVVTLDEEKT